MVLVAIEPDFDSWANAARWLIAKGCAPEETGWAPAGEEAGGDLLTLASEPVRVPPTPSSFPVPRPFIDMARLVVLHRSPVRFALLYRLLWRLVRENRRLLELSADPDVREARLMEKAVRNDEHRMHAFVRFRRTTDEAGGEHWIAWHRPDHRIVRLAAPFFAERFRSMRWSIVTPDESVSWNGESLAFGPGCPAPPSGHDDLEQMWRAYYRSVSNPARANAPLLRQHLPLRYRASLPEAEEISGILQRSGNMTGSMLETSRSAEEVSARALASAAADWETLRESALGCTACPLHCAATQAVWGEGPLSAPVMLVGEQPGKEEDLSGRPFVGPAGRLLNEALSLAGLRREELYVTNAVKHFKFEQVGERRLDRAPASAEIGACRPWLAREVEFVRPRLLICLGATAAQAVLGRRVLLRDERGRFQRTALCDNTFVTVHPSSVLRTPAGPSREEAWRQFRDDLQFASRALSS